MPIYFNSSRLYTFSRSNTANSFLTSSFIKFISCYKAFYFCFSKRFFYFLLAIIISSPICSFYYSGSFWDCSFSSSIDFSPSYYFNYYCDFFYTFNTSFTYLSISSLLVFLSLSLSFSLTVLTLILPILLDLTLSYTFFPALSTFYLYPTANLTSVKVAFYSFSTFFHSSTSFSIFFSSRLRFFTYSINLD